MAFEKILPGEHPVGIFAPALAAIKVREESAHEDHEVAKREVALAVVRALHNGATEFADESILLPAESVPTAA